MDNIAINVNTYKSSYKEALNEIKDTILKLNKNAKIFIFEDSKNIDFNILEKCKMMISLGGDGTLLGTVREIFHTGIPVLGINIGNLGFLTAGEINEKFEILKSVFEGCYNIEERMMLECIVNDGYSKYYALNDIVISKNIFSGIVRYGIEVDEELYTYFYGDGVVISTPTGSTAYSLSAGGPIVYPTLDTLSITPICSHTVGLRTLIAKGESKIRISSSNISDIVYLTIDGQIYIEVNYLDKIILGKAKSTCKLIKLANQDYFDILRKKITYRSKEGDINENKQIE